MSTFRIFRLSIRKIPKKFDIYQKERIATEKKISKNIARERIAKIYGNESKNYILEMACEDD